MGACRSRTNADDRLPLASLGPVEGGSGRRDLVFRTARCRCERIYLGRVAQKSLECSPGNFALAWIVVELEPVVDHHGAILRVGEDRNLGSETATAGPT